MGIQGQGLHSGGIVYAVFRPDILARGGKTVHAINKGGGGAMCHAGVRSTAAATGVWGHAPPGKFLKWIL